MKIRQYNWFAILRRLLAAASLLSMTGVFFVPVLARWLGWLPRLQLVPAILAGAVLQIVALAIAAVLFGRLYCAVMCPLGIVQDLFRFCFGWIVARRGHRSNAGSASNRIRFCDILRYSVLALFLLAIPFGLTGLIEPYGIFGRFLAMGVRRLGEPAAVTIVWALGLVIAILLLTLVRPRLWCNAICPVGTFLGLFSRFSLFRVRLDSAACVKCGACANRCGTGALTVRADGSIAIDSSSCVVCGNCLGACPKGALSFFRSAK